MFKDSKSSLFSVLMIFFLLAVLKKQLTLIWAIKVGYVNQLLIYRLYTVTFFRLYWEKLDVYSREMVQMGVAAFKSVSLHFRLQGS